jgi:DNA-binding NarL/FixJ family response regulator
MHTHLLILHPRELVCQTLANHLAPLGYVTDCSGCTVEDAVLTARQTPPDIALIDSSFDNGHGFEVAHLLLLTNPKTRVILCLPTDPTLLSIAIQTDASGYLPNDFELPELETCLHCVRDRFRYVSPTFAQLLRLPIPAADPAVVKLIEKLTVRQKDFLGLVCSGLFQKEIADKMGISEETVVSYKKDFTRRFGLSSRRDLRSFLALYRSCLDF